MFIIYSFIFNKKVICCFYAWGKLQSFHAREGTFTGNKVKINTNFLFENESKMCMCVCV